LPLFNNAGTFRKSAGGGTTTVDVSFNNAGTLDVQSGTVSFTRVGTNAPSGVFNTTNGTALLFNANYTFNDGSQFTGTGDMRLASGTFMMSGNITFTKLTQTGGTLAGTNVLNGIFNWANGSWTSGGATTIAAGSTLNITNNSIAYTMGFRSVTNNGTVVWTGGTIQPDVQPIQNNGLWDAQANNTITFGGTLPLFNNAGTFRKSAGGGTTTVDVSFNNAGTLDVQSGTVSFTRSHTLTGGVINIGISSLSNFGRVNLSGAAGFTGNFSANLNGGYIPITNNSFAVITYGSLSGTFANYSLPFADAWTTNYTSTTFSLYVLNARPILTIPTNQIVNELTLLTVTNTAMDLDIPTNTLTYTLLAAPGGAQIDTNGIITWMPGEAQGPSTNIITTVVTDNGLPALSATNSFSVVVNEINVPPVLSPLANTNINELTTLTLTNAATDSDIPTNPLTYALLNAPTGAVIDTNGVITWTPTEAQGPSTNTFTTVVTDTNMWAVNTQSFTVTNTFTVVVNEINVAPMLTVPTNQTINELTLYTNNATATDADIPANALTFALVSGPTNLTVSPSGAISWTPSEAQGPSTNVVQIVVTDFNPWAVNAQHLSATNSFTLTINEVNAAPVLGALSDRTVNPGQTINFTATATDSDLPTNALTFSLIAPPAGASLDSSNGLFNWRPTLAQANTTNVVQVQVTDTNAYAVNSQSLSDTKSFTVIVNPLAPVILTPVTYTNGHFIVSVSGSTGPDYVIMASTNLATWSDLSTNLSPATPFQFDATNAMSVPSRYYRARLSP